MRVLGVEGTAWCASAAVHDTETDETFIESDAYEPESGGIHPREAAEHMGDAVPRVIETALARADGDIDVVAFSKGPGLGPCLRVAGTAARALAGTLDVPLVGVNHMVAHLEIGRHESGFDSPVCLNASGANAHLLGFHDGRYRVLGETMDTGVGNAIDKFTRHLGWTHPGGPKVEEAAKDGEYVDLPYVVKGMDFSFSGLMSAAKDAVDDVSASEASGGPSAHRSDDGTPVEDVCFSLQEHVFAMLTEVSERALSLTGSDELVLGGGVGQNARLREMLAAMCEQRGAEFYAPEPRFLRDNAGMIAVLGAKMAAAGDTIAIADSAIDPDFRPDEVPVTWRANESVAVGHGVTPGTSMSGLSDPRRGAEAVVDVQDGVIVKRRIPKGYRHPDLDAKLRRDRTVLEARLFNEARKAGVPTPLVHDVDVPEATLRIQHVGDSDLADALTTDHARTLGQHLARLHGRGLVHGDPTTKNVRVGDRLFLVDFGLGYHSGHPEDHAMDLHVFEGSVAGTATDSAAICRAFEDGYAAVGDETVLERLAEVRGRGRYQ
ncbi:MULTISPECIES: bifunctional N(6)-L-threonylcarbamoyladenine synthase/serine/threonine protein kinase [Halolamina]|uniref:Probable bifunctional tRNA threonylcarbamoyladenosine biosynthesis protein n=1 Tax=Halolamina pelagica TaxID=699431 RepID=A0A1I5Q3Q8_9EURY|nr:MULTISPECIES: bifunctional N(6)-L-threonylcarbamoyladenine synthase/serine/threonine protein kinase [Halolamina]NHX35081.1 bifunctional N(6)-L-threonylcarbamoyladenine synthase/serine/threonine protein kinase [Halolamina sp. R1-12]SFP40827.1 bifunctional N6-L-threonylcarbamoyladenine synthase / protein kinase Bud32 [Halolamina pelagica]